MGKLKGKTVLITGATSGIGRAAALEFAKAGASVVLGSRDATKGDALAAEIRKEGGRAVFRRTDVTREADARALVEAALGEFGRLDVAFNNAGLEATGPLVDSTEETFDRVFAVNVKGVWWCARAEIPALRRSGGGVIINTSSTAGSRGFANASLYTAAKHAVEGLSKALALELAQEGIRVNVLAPGPTDTPMLDRFTGGRPQAMASRVPMGRLATPEEVARAAVFLASADASFVSGVVLPVNGGMAAA
jgi:NAD(P)-dependent dehydrogenase (short-subunit alcohol dehydrogenase family)